MIVGSPLALQITLLHITKSLRVTRHNKTPFLETALHFTCTEIGELRKECGGNLDFLMRKNFFEIISNVVNNFFSLY